MLVEFEDLPVVDANAFEKAVAVEVGMVRDARDRGLEWHDLSIEPNQSHDTDVTVPSRLIGTNPASRPDRVRCPYCEALISPRAKVCQLCNSRLETSTSTAAGVAEVPLAYEPAAGKLRPWAEMPGWARIVLVIAASLWGFGGLWLGLFDWQLGKRALIPINDPQFESVVETDLHR